MKGIALPPFIPLGVTIMCLKILFQILMTTGYLFDFNSSFLCFLLFGLVAEAMGAAEGNQKFPFSANFFLSTNEYVQCVPFRQKTLKQKIFHIFSCKSLFLPSFSSYSQSEVAEVINPFQIFRIPSNNKTILRQRKKFPFGLTDPLLCCIQQIIRNISVCKL